MILRYWPLLDACSAIFLSRKYAQGNYIGSQSVFSRDTITMASRILLVDDESSILAVLKAILSAEGHDVVAIQDGNKAVQVIQSDKFNLLISDIRMTPVTGMELLTLAHQVQPSMAVIMITAYASVETAVEAVKMGTYDYITKPFKVNELIATVHSALKYSRSLSENVDLQTQAASALIMGDIVAESTAMRNVCELIRHVAPTSATVLLCGERGTGKGLIARTLHQNSDRKDKHFATLDCAQMPQPALEDKLFGADRSVSLEETRRQQGLFETTSGGTVYLANIDAIPLDTQEKILGLLQDKKITPVGLNEPLSVDIRLLAGTASNMQQAIKDGAFREDLYQRISVIPIRIRPLRERREDILPLIAHILPSFLPQGTPLPSLAPSARDFLMRYHWPGNVRQLVDTLKFTISRSSDQTISTEHLPPDLLADTGLQSPSADPLLLDHDKGRSLRSYLRAKEKEYLDQVLKHTGGDKTKAAKVLKISLATLYRKLPDHDSSAEQLDSQP